MKYRILLLILIFAGCESPRDKEAYKLKGDKR